MSIEALVKKVNVFYKLATEIDDLSEHDELAMIYSDVFKDIYGFRPRFMKFDEMTTEQLREELNKLQGEASDLSSPPSEAPPSFEMEGTVSSDETDPFEDMPFNSGMGKRK